MAIRRFSSSDSTRIWEHLNRLADDVESMLSPIPASASGRTTIAVTGSGSRSVAVTFPPGRFTSPPNMVISPYGTTGQEHLYQLKSASVSKDGAVIWTTPLTGAGAANLNVHWVAMS